MKSIDGYLRDGVGKWKDKPYIWKREHGEFRSVTYGQTVEAVWQLAAAIRGMGAQGVGILYGENSFEWMAADLCLMGYTGVSVPIDKEWTVFDIRNCLNSLEVSLFFYSKSKAEVVDSLRHEFPEIQFFCLEEDWKRLQSLGKEYSSGDPGAVTDMEKTVKILFTSGTTAFPKAIPLSQKNLFANWETLFKRTPMTEADSSYIFLPLNHVYSGVANFLYSIISGMELYLCTDLKCLVPDLLEIRPTVVCTVPVILERIAGLMEEGNENVRGAVLSMLRHIRFLYCGGSPVGLERKKRFRDLGIRVLEAYGTTETSSVIALERPGDPNLSANGIVFENLSVKIDSPDPEGVGEICVRGDSRTAGYLNVEDNSLYFDRGGYFHTGDLGALDQEGYLYVKGRKRRVLDNGNGKNVYADEVEALILSEPSVIKASVYLAEGKITASILTGSKGMESEKETAGLLTRVNEKLPRYKKIERLIINQSFTGSWFKEEETL